MRIAFVSIPRFACAAELLREPSLAGVPLIVGDAAQPRRVFDCSSAALLAGVRPDLAIRKALGLCPDAVVLPPDPVLYRSKWDSILNALDDVVPEIEDFQPGGAYLNVDGLGPHYRGEPELGAVIVEAVRLSSGLSASVGLATGKLPAHAAALSSPPGTSTVVPEGAEASFLASAEIELLPVEREVLTRLHLFGLDTIADVARLSLPELQSQFGTMGRRICDLAHGHDSDPLRPRLTSEGLNADVGFDAPVAGIEVMIAVARQLLSRLVLPLRGRAVRELTLQAELVSGRGWEHRLVFREAVSDIDRLLYLLRSSLTNFPPPNAINSLCLGLAGLTGESGKQLLLGEKRPLQQQLEEAIRQLKARYGYSPIYRCVDVEAWSLVPEDRQILVESDV